MLKAFAIADYECNEITTVETGKTSINIEKENTEEMDFDIVK